MTSQAIRDPYHDHLLTPHNCALLVIDYQPVQVASIASVDKRTLVANVVAVAKTAKLYEVPVVLSTVNVKTGRNQPMIHQLREVFPDLETTDRTSINAWEDQEFIRAVLIYADVCPIPCREHVRATHRGSALALSKVARGS